MTSSLADEILRRLLEAGEEPVSGQRLARSLGVTRTAVWKGVEALRALGYRVQSRPARGYHLAEGPRGLRPGEVESNLRTRCFGRPTRYLTGVDSTNREAERWALQGAPEGALVVAEHQRSGRGRLGRAWHDLPGRSLLFSLVLRPPIPPAEAPTLTFAAAVALAEALSLWVPRTLLEIKWPNDVLIAGRKVAGILLEMRCESQRVEHVILGLGCNVEGATDEFPEEVRPHCTTVAAHADRGPDRLALLCTVLEKIESAYEGVLRSGFLPLQAQWNEWFRGKGQWLRVQTPSGALEGRALGLGPGGALLLDPGDLPVAKVYAGDVEWSTSRVE